MSNQDIIEEQSEGDRTDRTISSMQHSENNFTRQINQDAIDRRLNRAHERMLGVIQDFGQIGQNLDYRTTSEGKENLSVSNQSQFVMEPVPRPDIYESSRFNLSVLHSDKQKQPSPSRMTNLTENRIRVYVPFGEPIYSYFYVV